MRVLDLCCDVTYTLHSCTESMRLLAHIFIWSTVAALISCVMISPNSACSRLASVYLDYCTVVDFLPLKFGVFLSRHVRL